MDATAGQLHTRLKVACNLVQAHHQWMKFNLAFLVVLAIGCSGASKTVEQVDAPAVEPAVTSKPSKYMSGPIEFCGKTFERDVNEIVCELEDVSDFTRADMAARKALRLDGTRTHSALPSFSPTARVNSTRSAKHAHDVPARGVVALPGRLPGDHVEDGRGATVEDDDPK